MSSLFFGTRTRSYVSHDTQWLLQADAGRPEGPNVGIKGQHLTIAFLMDEAEAAESLCLSIAEHLLQFQGEVLMLHSARQRTRAEALGAGFQKAAIRFRLIEVQTSDHRDNGTIRNLAVAAASAPWFMWLSADIWLTSNFIPKVQREIAELGCPFMIVKPAESAGEAPVLVLENDQWLSIELERAAFSSDEGFLLTAFVGAALLFEVRGFDLVGAYDEALPGLEDIDLSIRIFQFGFKVGVASPGGLRQEPDALPHHSTLKLYPTDETARIFSRKHGISWRHHAGTSAEQLDMLVRKPERPKIALIVDVDNWAFANIARQLSQNLSDRFDFVIIPVAVVDDLPQLFIMCEDCDVIHFFWREVPRVFYSDHQYSVESRGIDFQYFLNRFYHSRTISTAVYDHLFLDPHDVEARRPLFNDLCSGGYYVCSQKLYDIYAKLPGYRLPDAVLPDGVDLKMFGPANLARMNDIAERPIVVGWVGNSAWAHHLGDPKGVHTILKPALQELIDEGVPLEMHFADRQQIMIAHSEMAKYYARIDVLVCASDIEGTPNPVLEAMACGVPVVTTDVGIVRQALGSLQQDFILPSRSVSAMKAALRRLHEDRSLFAALSAENLESIQSWSWPMMAERFGAYFDGVLAKQKAAATASATTASAKS